MNIDNASSEEYSPDQIKELNKEYKQFLNKRRKRYFLPFLYGFVFGVVVMELFSIW